MMGMNWKYRGIVALVLLLSMVVGLAAPATPASAEQTYTLDRTISNGQMTVVSATRDGGRLIIHGKRIAPNENEEKFLQENAATIPPYWVSILVLAAPLMAFGLFTMFVTECVKRRRYRLPTEIKRKKKE